MSTEEPRPAAPAPDTSDDCARAAREWLEHGNRTIYSLAKLLRGREAAARAEEREAAAQYARDKLSKANAGSNYYFCLEELVIELDSFSRSRAAQEKP